jgi:hypothetical protein
MKFWGKLTQLCTDSITAMINFHYELLEKIIFVNIKLCYNGIYKTVRFRVNVSNKIQFAVRLEGDWNYETREVVSEKTGIVRSAVRA